MAGRTVEEAIRIKQEQKRNYMRFQMELAKMPKIDLYAKDAVQLLKDHLTAFQSLCVECGELPSLANYALSLHMSRKELMEYLSGHKNIDNDVFDQLHLANDMLGAVLEDNMLSGTNHVVGSIFIAKNNFGYKDSTEQIIVHQHQGLTEEELKRIASDLPDVLDVEYTEVQDRIEEKDDEEPV